MKIDTLTKLNNKKKMWISPKHPLFFESLDFKVIYSAGIFMHAVLNKSVNTLNNFELERLMMKGFGLSSKEAAAVIKLTKEEKQIVDKVIAILNTTLKKYLFLLDLISVSIRSNEMSEEEKQSIMIFSELLKIDSKKVQLFFDFMNHAFRLDTDKCIKTYAVMIQTKMPITISELKYYIPEIEYVTTIDNKRVKPGSTLLLVDNCKIMDSIIIPKGTTLHIESAVIQMFGTIIVDGGKLIIRDSKLSNESKDNNTLIYVKNYSEVEIYHTLIDCKSLGSAINQENGNLRIEDCKIYHTTIYSAIKFWGNQITIKGTAFKGCFSVSVGGAIQVQSGRGLITDCSFEDCEAKNGGAIFSTNEIMIFTCRFKYCKVIEFGPAIYYKGEVKSNIVGCEYYECYPEREEVIQYLGGIEESLVSKEYTIKVSTILDRPIRVTELGIINITDCVIYMNRSITCSGILNIKNAKLIANKMNEGSLFHLERSRGCLIESSEFDGSMKVGIIWTIGTRLHVHNSLFRNSANVRAIYDVYEPIIVNCIFSNCIKGAINTCAGEIRNCSFINCREKSGAGVLIYGFGGKLEHCKFVRCVSEYSGGAIDKSSGTSVIDCTFEECKPDDMN